MSEAEASDAAVVDTNVVSYVFKNDTRAALYRPLLEGRTLAVSFMTVAELEYWAEVRQWGAPSRSRLRAMLTRYVIHFPDSDTCLIWARVKDAAHRAGRQIETADAWIAATALTYNIPLVTHNPGDYAGVPGLTLLTG